MSKATDIKTLYSFYYYYKGVSRRFIGTWYPEVDPRAKFTGLWGIIQGLCYSFENGLFPEIVPERWELTVCASQGWKKSTHEMTKYQSRVLDRRSTDHMFLTKPSMSESWKQKNKDQITRSYSDMDEILEEILKENSI